MTKHETSRVVYNGAATFRGIYLNHVVLSRANLLNRLTDVLTCFVWVDLRVWLTLSKYFFQIFVPEDQRDLFRLVWFRDNGIKRGETQVLRFSNIAFYAIQRLIDKNFTNTSRLTLKVIENNRYMDDLLIADEFLANVEVISRELKSLYESRGFKLRKRSANYLAQPVLLSIPKCDLGSNIREINLGLNPMPDSIALGLTWDFEKDSLNVHCNKNLTMPARLSRREMLATFTHLVLSLFISWEAKLILRRAIFAAIGRDDELPKEIMIVWSAWLCLFQPVLEVSIPRHWFWGTETETRGNESVSYQLHGFSDVSNDALSCVVYLRRRIGRRSNVVFVHGKSKLVLLSQEN